MSHMVIYRGTDGKPGYHQTDDIHDAVTFVEQLRNDKGVEHARIFRLEEVSFEYRPYFRVELKAGDPAITAAPATPAVVAAAPEPIAEPAAPVIEASTAASPAGPAAAPTITEPKSAEAPSETTPETKVEEGPAAESDNGVGARRGLFGR